MRKSMFIAFTIIIIITGIAIGVSNQKSNVIYLGGNRYINQDIEVPKKYIGDEIVLLGDYACYELNNYNKEYHIAVKIDNKYYFYKTKSANGINFSG